MSFTEKKFSKLSPSNQLRKTLHALQEWIAGRKSETEARQMMRWLSLYGGFEYPLPQTPHGWKILSEKMARDLNLANPYLEKNPFDDPAKERQTIPVTVLLDNIRSPFNTGSIFRSCEALGVEKVIPCGITPTPEKNSKVKKAFKNLDIPLEYRDDAVEAVQNFKKEGYFIYAIEKTENSRSLRDTELSFPAVCVLGNEEFGVNPEILEISDAIIHIPLLGRKNSLNVSVAAGIVLFEIQRNF